MIADWIEQIIAPACRRESAQVVKSSWCGEGGQWRRLIFVVEQDNVYAVREGKEYGICVSDPNIDLEAWVNDLRAGKSIE